MKELLEIIKLLLENVELIFKIIASLAGTIFVLFKIQAFRKKQ